MIHEDHNRPGLTILPMAQDAALTFYGDVGLTDDPEEAGCFQAIFKAAFLGSNCGHPQAAWETLKGLAPQMLSRDRSAALLKWMHDAYTYHPANLNMCWASILLRYANAPGGWPDVGQTVEEQRQFDEFAAFFLREWDRDGFNARLEAEQSKPPSDWDRQVHMRYGLVPLDDDGKDSLPFLYRIYQGAALRRAVRDFNFPARPDFPHAKMRAAAQLAADEAWMPPGVPLGRITEVA